MKNYIYKVTAKPEQLLKNGFSQFENDLYAMRLVLSDDTRIMKLYHTIINSDEFKRFITDNDETYEETNECQLCVSFSANDNDKGLLFLNAPDGNLYYNSNTLLESCGNIINTLLHFGIIKRIRYYGKD